MNRLIALASILIALTSAIAVYAAMPGSPSQPAIHGRDSVPQAQTPAHGSPARADAPGLIDHYRFTIEAPALPLGALHNTFAMAIGPDSTIYIFDTDLHRVQRFSADGTPLGAWGGSSSAEGRFYGDVFDLTLNAGPDGRVWIQDGTELSRLQIFDRQGQFLERRVAADDQPDIIRAIAPDGSVYTSKGIGQEIVRRDSEGQALASWGSSGAGDGQFGADIQVDAGPDGSIYVADSDNHRIQRFTADGRFLGKWGEAGSGPGQFNEYIDLAISPDGTVYTTDVTGAQLGGGARIQAFDATGTFLRQFDWVSDSLEAPADIDVGPDLTVYVLANGTDYKVMRFNPQGVQLEQWPTVWGKADFGGVGALAPAPDGSFFAVGGLDIWQLDVLGTLRGRFTPGEADPSLVTIHSGATGPDGTLWLQVEHVRGPGVLHLGLDGRDLGSWRWDPDPPGQSTMGDIDVGADGSVYVSEFPTGRIRRFDAAGQLQASWFIGGEPRDQERPLFPAVALAPDGTVVTLDRHFWSHEFTPPHMVRRFSPDGRLLSAWTVEDGLGWTEPMFDTIALDIVIAPNGVAYISGNALGVDKREEGVWAFTLDGQRLGLIRPPESAPTKPWDPAYLAVDARGRLLVSESESGVHVFDTEPQHDAWRLRYYDNPHLVDWPLAAAEIDEVDLDWGTGAPAAGLPVDGFSARLERRLVLPAQGHRFRLVADGGARLWLGDRLVVDRWSADSVDETGSILIPPDGLFAQLEYTDPGGSAALRLEWATEGPPHVIYLPATRAMSE